MSKSIGLIVVLGALFAVGCGDKGSGGDSSSKPAGSGEAKASGDGVGVAECDDYLKKAEACTSKMPAEGKDAWKQGIETSRDAWKQAAAQGGAAKDALKTSCKAAADAMTNNPACK